MTISNFEEPRSRRSVYGKQPVCDVVETPGTGEVYPIQMDQLSVSPICNLWCGDFTEKGGEVSLPLQAGGQTLDQEVGVETGGASG